MKISNPKLYGAGNGTGSILTTVSYVSGQLLNLSNTVNDRIDKEHQFTEQVSGALTGYVPLAADNKIAAAYLPKITLSETQTRNQTQITSAYNGGEITSIEAASIAVTQYIKETPELSGMEIGDILIILPPTDSTILVNDYLVGTWILADINNDSIVSATKLYMPSTGKTKGITVSGITDNTIYIPDAYEGIIDLSEPFKITTDTITNVINTVSGELNTKIDATAADLVTVSGELNTKIDAVSDKVSDILAVDNYVIYEEITFSKYIAANTTIEDIADVIYTGGLNGKYPTKFNAQVLLPQVQSLYQNILDTTNAICKFAIKVDAALDTNYLPVVTCVYESTNTGSQTSELWSSYELIYPEVTISQEQTQIIISVITAIEDLLNKRWRIYFTTPVK